MNNTLRYEMVREFHAAYDEPTGEIPDTSPERMQARASFLQEEINEFETALSHLDIVEVFDALIDMHYFIEGSRLCFGTPMDFPRKRKYADGAPEIWKKLIVESSYLALSWSRCRDSEDQTNFVEDLIMSTADSIIVKSPENKPLSHYYMAGFREVHRSNMAKVGPGGKVLRREDGKILKPEGWTPPDLKGVLGL